MASQTLDIVNLIENNPLTRLNGDYHGRLINKIKDKFNNQQQQLFVASFYCYLNNDPHLDFVVDLDNVWKWCGFGRKDNAKTLINKFFNIDVEYKIFLRPSQENKIEQRGRKSEQILMTVNTFKKFCLKARTKRADEIHDYFIGLEEIIHEVLEEESVDLMNKLKIKEEEHNNEINSNVLEMEKNILINSANQQLVYIGVVGDDLVKFGYSKGVQRRVLNQHKKDFPSFVLKYTVHSDYYIELESVIKEACNEEDSDLFGRRVNKVFNGKNQTELIQLDSGFTVEDLYNEVVIINENLIKKKELGGSKIISCLRKQVKELKEENSKLRLLLKDNNIKEDGIVLRKIDERDLMSERYLYKFLEEFVEDKNNGIHFMRNKDFYDLYYKYIDDGYSLIYLFTKTKFNDIVTNLPFVKWKRKTMSKCDINYIPGGDNRYKGKEFIIDSDTKKWISEQY